MKLTGTGLRFETMEHGGEYPDPMPKRLRYQRPRLGIGLIMALAIGTFAGVFGYYGLLLWRLFLD